MNKVALISGNTQIYLYFLLYVNTKEQGVAQILIPRIG